MDGWQVMAAPLAVVIRLGALVTAVVIVVWLARRLAGAGDASGTSGAGPGSRSGAARSAGAGRGRLSDGAIVDTYERALVDGWPPGQLATYIEVGRRSGTSGEYVRSVIDRRWAV